MKSNNIQISQNPIFIVSFPRSGTTLLQSMLATQENVFSFQETHFFCTTMRYIQTNEKGFIKFGCLETVLRNIKEKTDHVFSTTTTEEIIGLSENSQLNVKMLFEFLVTDLLLKQIQANQLSKIVWIEKTPGHIFQLDIIQEYYPNARFIEITRNPLNAIYSCKIKFPDGDKYTASALAHRWKRSVEAFKRFREANAGRAYSLKYEELVNEPESKFREISEFLDITPDIGKLKNLQKTARQFVLKRETWKNNNINSGITNSNTDYKWALNEKLKIRYLLREELTKMGYSNGYPFSQMLYNGWMDFISKLTKHSLLNPLKKPTKYLVKRAGLWPYQK